MKIFTIVAHMTDDSNRSKITRRQAVNTLLFTTGLLASTEATKVLGQDANTKSSDILDKSASCVLTPQDVEGPYYFDPKFLRSDITEGKEGVPLKLLLQVIDTKDCTSIPRARVDVWHCDNIGLYSGYEGQGDDQAVSTTGKTFLRGTQMTDTLGQVTFTTIYPGWYPGRTPHIHLKVFLDQQTVLIGQLYFIDAISEYIYKNVAPYNTRTLERDTVNTTDISLRNGNGRDSFFSIKEEADYYLASIIIGVDRNASPTGEVPAGANLLRETKPTTPLVPGVANTL